ncbi:MAG TPA: Gfo/Idh/MocA family oxidoreductase, partial [Roseiflexaceae bacterium]|nr:Gfo/Idh/MocA family oxidoreductase [Roseiflexaceae bacterium]
MPPLRIAQYGTKHGHAAGKLLALKANPDVDLAGVFEPDVERRRELERAGGAYAGVRWFDDARELLGDPTIVAVASEGRNDESLDQTEQIVEASKHVWYDKPAGADWAQWQRVAALAERRSLHVQMGYMFRYHDGFRRIAEWARSGLLGQVYAIRAHMSTWISEPERRVIARHPGGIFYDLAGHMLDQIVWLLGRPQQITAFLRDDSGAVPGFKDNTLAVLAYPRALAYVDIAAIEATPLARRFEVYGDRGNAIMEPFEPAGALRLCLAEAHSGYQRGEQFVQPEEQSRQRLYELELEAFLAVIRGERPPERPVS